MKPMVIELVIRTVDGLNACELLARAGNLSKSKVKRAMSRGAAWLIRPNKKKRRLRRATFTPLRGDTLTLYYDPAIIESRPPAAECLADREGYSIWFKPAGLMTQGSNFGDHCSLQYQVERHFKPRRRVLLVHRLDREASGLILIAHDTKAAGYFGSRLRRRQMTKKYIVRLRGDLSQYAASGEIDHPLDGKTAKTLYRVTGYDPQRDISTADITLVTGRRHQIRRHFHRIGFPVMGDPRYGAGNKNTEGLQLVATSLTFVCPFSNREVTYRLDEKQGMEVHEST